MKILFLDIDGVLVTRQSLQRGQSGIRAQPDPRAIRELNRVLQATQAHIVVTSTWRLQMGAANLDALFRDNWDVQGNVIGCTANCTTLKNNLLITLSRAAEIQGWLDMVARSDSLPPVERFVIVDDESDMGHLNQHLVQTTFEEGLTPTLADNIIWWLNL
jgi:hypothetical protein